MKLSERTITALGKIITGDEKLSPSRGGPALVKLFNEFGANDIYARGFPSRWMYAEEKLRSLNDTLAIDTILRNVLDPREYFDSGFNELDAISYVNQWLKYDGYEVIVDNDLAKVRSLSGVSVACDHPFQESDADGHVFIDEQIRKAETKISEGDYDGAITNARSLLEAVLKELEITLVNDHPYSAIRGSP